MKKLIYLFLLCISLNTLGQSIQAEDYFTSEEIKSAHTAINKDYLTEEEKGIFLFNNLARMYPKKFYYLYEDYVQSNPYQKAEFKTNFYYTSLTKKLKRMDAAPALLPDKKMFELAECWAVESGKRGVIGHNRRPYCEGGYQGENCSYGHSIGLDIVMQLLIDKGVQSLGHRKNMLNPYYKGLGTAIRPHERYDYCAVQDFSPLNDVLREKARQQRLARQRAREERARKLEKRKMELDSLMGLWTEQEMKKADACRDLSYLTKFEKSFYLYVNLIRLYPRKFKKLIWNNGPYFDRLLSEVKAQVHTTSSYKQVSEMLKAAPTSKAIVPTKEFVQLGRCVGERFLNNSGNANACYNGAWSWSIRTFHSQGNTHRDIMNILLDDRDREKIFSQNYTTVIYEHYRDSKAKVFLR